MAWRTPHRHTLIAISVIALLVLFLFCLQTYRLHTETAQRQQILATVAVDLTALQFQTQLTKMTALMKQQGMQATFAYVANEISSDPSFAKDCHPLLHQLGHAAYAYYGSFAGAIQYQNELCNSGFTHGVLEAYLGSSSNIEASVKTACASISGNTFDAWQCYHGLGHGIMQASLERIPTSLSICSTLPTTFAVNACANGVFMEHFVVESHDGTIPTTNPTSLNDCRPLTNPTYISDCYLYAPTAYLTVYGTQYANALNWCSGAEHQFIGICIAGVGSEAMKDNINNPNAAKIVCEMAAPIYQGDCIAGAIGMYINYTVSPPAATALCHEVFANHETTCEAAIVSAKNSYHI